MTEYYPTDDEIAADVGCWFGDTGAEDYEPSPYDGTYSEM